MYDIGNYYNASSVVSATRLLYEHPKAVIIAGGSDVLIRMREGRLAGADLICIRNIKEIDGVQIDENGDIYIGAITSFSHLTNNEIIKKHIPVLGEAVDLVGGPQVRNIGTIGGNICNGAVSADSAATVSSLEVLLRLLSVDGERLVPVGDFYLGPGKVDLKPGEMLTHIIVPRAHYSGYTGHYIKYSMRNAMDIATLGCSVVIKLDDSKKVIEDVKISFAVAAPVPFRCCETEKKLKGMAADEEALEIIEASVRTEINPRDSWRASKAFRIHIAGEIARRALKAAIEKQGGIFDE